MDKQDAVKLKPEQIAGAVDMHKVDVVSDMVIKAILAADLTTAEALLAVGFAIFDAGRNYQNKFGTTVPDEIEVPSGGTSIN